MAKTTRTHATLAATCVAALALLGVSVTVTGEPVKGDVVHAQADLPPATGDQIASVVALGDSVPAGAACDCTDFVSLVAQRIAARQGAAVSATNASVPSQTSDGLLEELADPEVDDAVRGADVVIIEIGANDFDSEPLFDDQQIDPAEVYGDALADLHDNLTAIVSTVRSLRSDVQVVLVGYWNNFEAGSEAEQYGAAYEANSVAVTDASNAVIAQVAAETGATYVDLVGVFLDTPGDISQLLEDDGDHPNQRGHELIANAVAAAVH